MIYFYKGKKDICIFWDLCILATYEALMNNFNKTLLLGWKKSETLFFFPLRFYFLKLLGGGERSIL